MERIGLRSASYPFDWLVTPDMEQIMRMIDTGFTDFIKEADLRQKEVGSDIFINSSNGFHFVHDFKGSVSLHDQMPEVNDKFKRRIDRFLTDICDPTLFVRYIADESRTEEGDIKDLKWTEDNLDSIMATLRSFNTENDIIWIANDGVDSLLIPDIYYVAKDDNDSVARRPLDKNESLRVLLTESYYPDRDKNLEVYRKKQRKKTGIVNRIRSRFK